MSSATPRPGGITAAVLAVAWRAGGLFGPLCVGVTMLAALAPAAGAWCGKALIDALTGAPGREPAGRVVAIGVASVAVGGVAVVLGFAAAYLTAVLQQRVARHIERELYDRVNRFVGLRTFEDPGFQDRLQVAGTAAQSAPMALTGFAVAVARAVAGAGAFLAVLLAVWPPMAALIVAATIPSLAGQVVLGRRQADVTRTTMPLQRRRQLYRVWLTDPRPAKEVRLFGLGDLFRGRMVAVLWAAGDAELAVARRNTLIQALLTALGAAVAAAGAGVVVTRAVHGGLSAGDVMLFVAAVAGLQTVLNGVAGQLSTSVRGLRLFGDYLAVLRTPPDLADGTGAPDRLRCGIELRDVWFRYDEAGPWILRGVDLTLPAGRAVGLVGANGAGKSTLIKLLCRMYDPQQGAILWDGVDIRTLSAAELRRRIGTTFQDFQVYDVTATENIGFGDVARLDAPEADLAAAVRQAARVAEIDDALCALPAGYDTVISRMHTGGPGAAPGVTLSGGQGQRLALARSLMRADADLLILDEPSSGLDAVAEHRVHETLRRLRAGRTSLLVSHRLSALRDADVIVVLSEGRITESGSHRELMAVGGMYAEMFTVQAAGYRETEPAERAAAVLTAATAAAAAGGRT